MKLTKKTIMDNMKRYNEIYRSHSQQTSHLHQQAKHISPQVVTENRIGSMTWSVDPRDVKGAHTTDQVKCYFELAPLPVDRKSMKILFSEKQSR